MRICNTEIEQISFLSNNADNFEQLLKSRGLPPVEVSGFLIFPNSRSHRLPLVILSLGSLGLRSGRELAYAETLTSAGMAVLLVDSFSCRGFDETASDQARLSFAASVADLLFAMDRIRQDPRINPEQIALMGCSRGGAAVILANDHRLMHLRNGVHPAAYIALYPPAFIRWRNPHPTSAPMLLLFGGRDSLVPQAQRKTWVESIRRAGGNVRSVIYPEAVHSFDAAIPETTIESVDFGRVDVDIEDNGRLTISNSSLRQSSTWAEITKEVSRICGLKSVVIGHSPLARDVAVVDILLHLRKTLFLE